MNGRSLGFAAVLASVIALGSCDEPPLDDRARTIAAVLAKADEAWIRSRPALAASKYAEMKTSVFSFYRGSFSLFLHDAELGRGIGASRYPLEGLFPLGIGDAHPENFGTLEASDGSLGLEANDFDAAARYPYLWQLRRLTVGMVLAARSSNPDDAGARAAAVAAERDVAHDAALAYASAIVSFDGGAPHARVVDPGDDVILQDIFARAAKGEAARSELELTTVIDASTGTRKLVRGPFDDPPKYYDELPKEVLDALPDTVARYRASLLAPPPASYFRVLDAAREYGAGVASRPKVRIIVLIDGPTSAPDDDVLLELKELGDSGAPAFGDEPYTADDPGARVVSATRKVWARADADSLWGASSLLGLPVQLKRDADSEKGVKLARMVGARGTPDALRAAARDLGALVARMDAAGSSVAPGTLHAIAASIGKDPEAFAREQADVSIAYADVVEKDYARFLDVLDVLGPRLGVPVDPDDQAPADVAALFGAPPPEVASP